MKKGDIAKFINPLDKNEVEERFKLLEDPDGGRVLVEGICDLKIRPTRVLDTNEIERVNS